MAAWLASFIFLVALSSSWACETMTINIKKNDSCYSHAVFLNPTSFEQYPNGTCIFYRVCAEKLSQSSNKTMFETAIESCVQIDKKEGTYSIVTKRIVQSVKKRKFKFKCPSYQKISTTSPVLLMRTHASSKISPYFVFRKGNVSANHMTTKEADGKRTVNFKSPLMAVDKYRSLYRIVIDMHGRNGRRQTSVGFRINAMESIQKGRWFAKDRVVTSTPWSSSTMRRARFNYFSIDGVKDVRATRRFYINRSFGGCPNDRGYMAIVERAYCRWEKRKKYFPSYLWTNSGSSYGRYNSRTIEAVEFRIYGIFQRSPDHYVRKTQNC